jgi:hypothetical protein
MGFLASRYGGFRRDYQIPRLIPSSVTPSHRPVDTKIQPGRELSIAECYNRKLQRSSTSTKDSQNKTMHRSGRFAALDIVAFLVGTL